MSNINQNQYEDFLENLNTKKFSNKDFTSFRKDLLDYATTYYKDQIIDFSEASLGGMLLEFAAIVGESLVFYAEQQFNELDYSTAVDFDNIINHIKRANIKSPKKSPSIASVEFVIQIERNMSIQNSVIEPIEELLPIIKSGTRLISGKVIFILEEDIDFTKKDFKISSLFKGNNNKEFLLLSKKGIAVSGEIGVETFFISNIDSEYYPSITLENESITTILEVFDSDNNEYYEVDYLTQSTVFKKGKENNQNIIQIVPAPYRYIIEENYIDNKTSIRFGNGNGISTRDNIFYAPEDLLLPLKGKDTFSRVDLNPSMLLTSDTLGISPKGKTVTIQYKFGGGSSHNVAAKSINQVFGEPIILFPNANELTSESEIDNVTRSIIVRNKNKAAGGNEALTIDELKKMIPLSLKSQSRIMSVEDLLARIITMPSNFGKINKVIALDNKFSLAYKDLHVICKDENNFYVEASDVVKANLSKYLNQFRVVGTNFNILDVAVYNFGLNIKIKVKNGFDPKIVIISAIENLVKESRFDILNIGDPININRVINILENSEINPGVDTVITNKKNIIVSKNSLDNFVDQETFESIKYHDNTFNPHTSYKTGYVYPPLGSIFELKYNFNDIKIIA